MGRGRGGSRARSQLPGGGREGNFVSSKISLQSHGEVLVRCLDTLSLAFVIPGERRELRLQRLMSESWSKTRK